MERLQKRPRNKMKTDGDGKPDLGIISYPMKNLSGGNGEKTNETENKGKYPKVTELFSSLLPESFHLLLSPIRPQSC